MGKSETKSSVSKNLISNKDQKFDRVHITKDTGKFRLFKFNRAPSMAHVKKLVESINTHGFITVILVDQFFNIIDGQHRWLAAKEAGSEIIYMIHEIDTHDVAGLLSMLNMNMKRMKDEDFFHIWCTWPYEKKESYLKLKKYFDQYDFDFFTGATVFGGIRGNEAFRNGTWEMSEEAEKRFLSRAGYIQDIISSNDYVSSFAEKDSFLKGVIKVACDPKYDHDQFMKRIAMPKLYSTITARVGNRVSNAAMYVSQLEYIYNWKAREVHIFSKTQN